MNEPEQPNPTPPQESPRYSFRCDPEFGIEIFLNGEAVCGLEPDLMCSALEQRDAARAEVARLTQELAESKRSERALVETNGLTLSMNADFERERDTLREALPKLRAGISQVLGTGLPSNSIVFAQDQWSKGYCAGVTAALTGFDDALRVLLAGDTPARKPLTGIKEYHELPATLSYGGLARGEAQPLAESCPECGGATCGPNSCMYRDDIPMSP